MSQQLSDIDWLESNGNTNKSAEAFFDTLDGRNNKQTAYNRYIRALNNCKLDEPTKNTLQAAFNNWKETKAADVYWARCQSERSAVKVAATLVEGAEPFAENFIREAACRARQLQPNNPEERQESEAVEQAAEENLATATGHATPDHREAGHAAADQGEVGHAAEDNDVSEQERSELLNSIAHATHTVCEWKIEGECVGCGFQNYQRTCVDALAQNNIKKTEIADLMSCIGVFAPFLPTPRMLTAFKRTMLEGMITRRRFSNPGIDDAAVGEAVRMYINGDEDDAFERLRSMPRKMRKLFETLLDQLPKKPDKSVSEDTFRVNNVSQIIQGVFNVDHRISVHFPNTDCEMQKQQKLKPDRPDVLIKVREKEVLFGEITGPSQETAESKNKWDLYRLARFGKSFLDNGHSSAPLLQIIYTQGTYLELTAQLRGMYLLQEVGVFTIPTTISMIPTLLADLPVLFTAQAEVHSHISEERSTRKRSWGFSDIVNAKKRLT